MKTTLTTTAAVVTLILTPGAMSDITQIIDSAGDGFGGHPLDAPHGIAVDNNGTVYVAGSARDDLFRIRTNGQISQVVGPAGDGSNPLDRPFGVVCDTVFAWVTGTASNNVFRDSGASLELIDETGDGAGNTLDAPRDIALARDGSRTTYVTGGGTNNAFSMSFDGSVVEEIIDATGDGTNALEFAFAIDTDAAGNVYVSGLVSNNVFKVEPGGAITQIIDATGDGTNALARPFGLAAADDGTVYVTGGDSDNVFRIDPDGTITQILDATGDGIATLDRPFGVGVDPAGNVYVAGSSSDNVFRITPLGETCVIIDATGDGFYDLEGAEGIAVRSNGDVYVTGLHSDNAFRITSPECPVLCPEDLDGSGAVDFGDILVILAAWDNVGGPEDLDGSGTVDFGDLLVVLGAWGSCP